MRAKVIFMKWFGLLLTKFNPEECFENKITQIADYEAKLI